MEEKKRSHVVLEHGEYDTFRVFLLENGIQFEPSGYGQNVYVSINATEEERNMIDSFLETL